MSIIAGELGLSWTLTGLVIVSALGIYVAIIVYSRLAGIRSHSRMSTFDFATTIAIGSDRARRARADNSRRRDRRAREPLQLPVRHRLPAHEDRIRPLGRQPPILLMADPNLLPDGLRRAHVTPQDVCEKLRLNGVVSLDRVMAVVLEGSGDVSVMHGDVEVDPDLFPNVVGREELVSGQSGAELTS